MFNYRETLFEFLRDFVCFAAGLVFRAGNQGQEVIEGHGRSPEYSSSPMYVKTVRFPGN